MNSHSSSTVVFSATHDLFGIPSRGFISEQPATDWQQSLLTGNGTLGALVLSQPYDETIYLSHAGLYLPTPKSDTYIEMASRLSEVQRLCLDGDYPAACEQINEAREQFVYHDTRDPFIAAFALHVKRPERKIKRYERAVDWMTAETKISVEDEQGFFGRSVFASRSDDVVVLRIVGDAKQSAHFSFAALPATSDLQKQMIENGVESSEQGVREGLLYFRVLFAHTNPFNPNLGYEGIGKIVSKGGIRVETSASIAIYEADEILVLVKIQPLIKAVGTESPTAPKTNFTVLREQLEALTPDYAQLLASHAKIHADLMGRVSLSLQACKEDRAKSSEQLNADSMSQEAPLAKIERAFDAGRYNIICSTGFNPPNLQGLWSGTWAAPWSGSFTTNGNMPCAVAFNLMGNMLELMEPYFRYHDDRWDGFRENAQVFFGARGFHIPAQLTLSPRETDFTVNYPHCFWHSGAAWALQFYYDYYQYTGDRKFLEERAYPLMKEAAAFYEDLLTITDEQGKLVFVPSYSPENASGWENNTPARINATMDISAAKQLLRHTISVAAMLGLDAELSAKWAELLEKMPSYEVGPDGSFREWLWPDLDDNHQHRHASQLYALYDEMPNEILNDAALVEAVEHTVRARLEFREQSSGMAFGIVQTGLASAHIGNAGLIQRNINLLAKGYWTTGMASNHDWMSLFNMDISGGFPYLCASALVYSDPGYIRFFPAKPAQWSSGTLKGVRLRGSIVVQELAWDGVESKVVLVSDIEQTVRIEGLNGSSRQCRLNAGVPITIELSKPEVKFQNPVN